MKQVPNLVKIYVYYIILNDPLYEEAVPTNSLKNTILLAISLTKFNQVLKLNEVTVINEICYCAVIDNIG